MCLQNRFITFDERVMPGPGYQKDGLFFDQHAHHNIPGYQDNVMVRTFLRSKAWQLAHGLTFKSTRSLQHPNSICWQHWYR